MTERNIQAQPNRVFRGAVLGGVLGALLTGVPWLGAGGTPRTDWPTAIVVAAAYGSMGAAAGLVVGAVLGGIVSAWQRRGRDPAPANEHRRAPFCVAERNGAEGRRPLGGLRVRGS